MQIEEIEWLDKEGKEAILKVVSETESLECFSCPCSYNKGDVLTEPLECLDVNDILLCDTQQYIIRKMDGAFKYQMNGKIKDIQNGIIEVCGFELHVDEDRIPKDMINGMFIQFAVSRIDIW